MKPHLIICIFVGLSSASCEKHGELKMEVAALDAMIQKDQAAVEHYEQSIRPLGGREGLEKLRLQAEILRIRVDALGQQNSSRREKWAGIDAKFSKLRPAAETFKASQPQ
jgi:hypothetical protein